MQNGAKMGFYSTAKTEMTKNYRIATVEYTFL